MMHSAEGLLRVTVLSRLVWRSPKDRVLLFQSIAVLFFVLILVLHSVGTELEWLDPLLMIFVCFFAVLAGYYGLLNWRRGKKNPGQKGP
jgi:hypothetical protein